MACHPRLGETACFSMVRSFLEYSSAVWDTFRQKDIDKLKKAKISSKILSPKNYRQTASVTFLIQNLPWTDLKTRPKNSTLLCRAMFKILNKLGLVKISINYRLIPAEKEHLLLYRIRC